MPLASAREYYLTQRREGAKKKNLTQRHKEGVIFRGRRLSPQASI